MTGWLSGFRFLMPVVCSSSRISSTLQARGLKMAKPNVIFILGGPGAGKGTQSKKIVQHFDYVHISAGDLLRAEKRNPTSKFGKLIEHHIKAGTIVPVEITCSLIEQAMAKSDKNNFLIDGFPRNEDNVTGWTSEMSSKVHLQRVLFLQCSQEICMQRCLARGDAGSGRSDDNVETLRKRLIGYEHVTLPIIKYYDELGYVSQIDASRTPDEVYADVEAILNNL